MTVSYVVIISLIHNGEDPLQILHLKNISALNNLTCNNLCLRYGFRLTFQLHVYSSLVSYWQIQILTQFKMG